MGIRQPLGTCHPPWFRCWLDNTGARLSRVHSRRPRSSGAGFQATSKHPKTRSSRRSDVPTSSRSTGARAPSLPPGQCRMGLVSGAREDMNESDLQLARAMVADERFKSENSTPGTSPTPLKKTVVGKVMEKLNTFRRRPLGPRILPHRFRSGTEITSPVVSGGVGAIMMASLWAGSDVDLSVLHQCRRADRLEFRLACLHKQRISDSDTNSVCEGDIHKFRQRRRRSGTWPRTRSLNAPSPIQQFGPCGRIMKNSAMVIPVAVRRFGKNFFQQSEAGEKVRRKDQASPVD
ncbi:hypothetical protein GEV33_010276 [Tenebrio molitor]|uniref:Uncharacterized protein n=1 Tax=Tenebrio molitor TaxID=7067 RepID=A0A8J6L9Z1_TENMO|nr:hypothetical protein GEV33_010276 [Tenebrio molitor]